MRRLLHNPCKCADRTCYKNLSFQPVMDFLNTFEARSKLEQDSILVLAQDTAEAKPFQKKRTDYFFLGNHLRRVCFQSLLGVSSHRIDRIGSIDARYGQQARRPSELTASIDAFCTVLYNSVAEPLPDRLD